MSSNKVEEASCLTSGADRVGVAGSLTGDDIDVALALARAWAMRSDVRASTFLR